MLVKGQKEVGRRVAVQLAEMIDPLDGFEKDLRVEAVWGVELR